MNKPLNIVILAAGQGKRMNSSLPKVLHPVSTKPMLQHVLETALNLQPSKLVVVYGHGGEQVRTTIAGLLVSDSIIWVEQSQQLGTGHALQCAYPHLDPLAVTLVLYGDVPLIQAPTLRAMLAKYDNNVVMLLDVVDNPYGYGRVVRDAQFEICGIVEEKDASQSEKAICEINTGFYLLPNQYLGKWLASLSNHNSQGEYYLTDVISLAYQDEMQINYVQAPHHYEVLGVNNKLQLEQLERIYQLRLARQLLEQGVTLADKNRIDIRGTVTAGQDCFIDINCVFSGEVKLGHNVKIGAGCILHNVTLADNVMLKPYSVVEDAEVGEDAQIGPFARVRPGSNLAAKCHIGNFVEIKNSSIGHGSKVNHLTYIGDAIVGTKVNIGAGTVTCNYDGKHKYQTKIADRVFIGSGTMLVAPVVVNQDAVIGAGSVITKDAPAQELTLARAKQVTVNGWLARSNNKGE